MTFEHDEDSTDAIQPLNESEDSGEFAAMLAAEGTSGPEVGKVGEKVSGTIIQIGEMDAFVDCGLRNELAIALNELQDDDGELTYKIGDQVSGHISQGPDGLKLSISLNLRDAGQDALQTACDSGTPVNGKVGETNKGGFAIDLGGVRAFCPYSQIDVRRVDDPTEYVGRSFDFKVLEISNHGKNVVVSRRALLQADRENQATETRKNISLDDALEGVVTRLVPFGAFVDIGGIEGLVHISQISHQRLGDPSEALKEGQTVQVKVLEIKDLGGGRSERISLSIKALASDPWPAAAGDLASGNEVQGQVTRLVDFGVFVELKPGIEGLIHISELANRRIIHPREVLNEGDKLTVRIVEVDLSRRRISLSRKQASDYEGD
ncbi:MAG: small subunit ribosomal protein S1 [Candidatus Krumholzibacteriia bacterium]|jgi:small subunit ribosomal protein S1